METLVLSAGYEPVARVSWKRAVTLLWEGKVEVVEEYQDRVIRSVTIEIKIPSVIRFLRTVRGRKRALKFSRENVYIRDHPLPVLRANRAAAGGDLRSRGAARARRQDAVGEHRHLLRACNQKKGGRTPDQARMRLCRRRPSRWRCRSVCA